MLNNKKTERGKLCGITICTAMLISALALTGCSANSASQVTDQIRNTQFGQAMSSASVTTPDDRKNYSQVQDANGNVYVTVIKFDKKNDNDIDPKKARDEVNATNVNWYQMITDDAKGAPKKEYGYLYFPSTTTISEMNKAIDGLATDYNCAVMTVPEYESYLNEDHDSDLTYTEATVYGPAAKKETEASN